MLHLLLFTSIASSPDQQQPEVDTPLGKIIGKTVEFEGMPVHTFQSIPYAKPPIGDLRFKKPQPVDAWEEPIVADQLPPGLCYFGLKTFRLLICGHTPYNRPAHDCQILRKCTTAQ